MLKQQKNSALMLGVSVGLFIFGFAFTSFASTDVGLTAVGQGLNVGTQVGFMDIVINIINVLLGLLGTVSIGIFLYGGYLYMVPAGVLKEGSADNITKSKALMKNAVIGLAIILLSGALVNFLFYMFTGRFAGQGGQGGEVTGNEYGYESGTGALGGGIIENHYPIRNAKDVARNTAIAITFKEQVNAEQIIAGANNQNCSTGITGDIKEYTNSVNTSGVFALFHKDSAVYSGGQVGEYLILKKTNATPSVTVTVSTTDCKTFLFKPNFLLGASDHAVLYTMGITGALQKLDGKSAFGNLARDGDFAYQWSFEVSTKLDVTPPRVTSVIPLPVPLANVADANNAIPRNYIIQVNFSEPVSPLSISGITNGTSVGFSSLLVGYDGKNATGTWSHGNGYKTTEFLTNEPCGTNSCGQTVYCLPANKTLDVLVKSPQLTSPKNTDLPFAADLLAKGVVDMAYNALDGNANNTADDTGDYTTAYSLNSPTTTSTKDSVTWKFTTNNTVDLVPPIVTSYSPSANEEGVDPAQSLSATFSKLLSATSVKPDSNYGDGFCGCVSDVDCKGGEKCGAQNFCVNATSFERIACYTYSNTPDCKLASGQKIEDVCKQQEHASIDQTLATTQPKEYTWYTPSTINSNVGASSYSSIRVNHGLFLLNKAYQPRYGSGIKDIAQNCYTPSGAPSCIVAQDINEQYIPGTGDWVSGTGTCDLTTTSLTTVQGISASYVTPKKVNQVSDMKVYSWDKSASTIFSNNSLTQPFNFLKDLSSSNTLNVALYVEDTNKVLEPTDVVYLIGMNSVDVIKSYITEAINETTQALVLASTSNFPQPSTQGTVVTPIQIRLNSDTDAVSYSGIQGTSLTGITGVTKSYPSGSTVQAYAQNTFSIQVHGSQITGSPFSWNTLTQPVNTFMYSLGTLGTLQSATQPLSITFGNIQTGQKVRLISADQIIDLDTAPTSKLQVSFK